MPRRRVRTTKKLDTGEPKPISTSRKCTTALLEYLRFFKGHKLLATEVAYNACKADVLSAGTNGLKIYEFEVKISKADLKKDFEKTLGNSRYKSSVLKHATYNDPDSKVFAPHYFWFVVPLELLPFAEKFLEDYPSYGILAWDPEGVSSTNIRRLVNTKIAVIRKAKELARVSRSKVSMDTVRKKILHRATSELLKLRLAEV